MSLCRMHLKKLVCQASNQGLRSFERCLGFFSQRFGISPQPWNSVGCVNTGAMMTAIRLQSTAYEKSKGKVIKKEKKSPNAKNVLGNVGRLIPHSVIQVISENGEDMGIMTRKKVIQTMEAHDLKLVVLRENVDPPVYKLMTGKQLFEEQIKLREKQKLAGPRVTQVSEMSILANIQKHDLDIKKKRLSQWIEKKHHVRITVTSRDTADGPAKEDVLEDLLKSLEDRATCSSDPKQRKDGQAVVCVLRPLSEKELQKLKSGVKQENQKAPKTPETRQSPNPELTNP